MMIIHSTRDVMTTPKNSNFNSFFFDPTTLFSLWILGIPFLNYSSGDAFEFSKLRETVSLVCHDGFWKVFKHWKNLIYIRTDS